MSCFPRGVSLVHLIIRALLDPVSPHPGQGGGIGRWDLGKVGPSGGPAAPLSTSQSGTGRDGGSQVIV